MIKGQLRKWVRRDQTATVKFDLAEPRAKWRAAGEGRRKTLPGGGQDGYHAVQGAPNEYGHQSPMCAPAMAWTSGSSPHNDELINFW